MWADQVTVCSEGYCFAHIGGRRKIVRGESSSEDEDDFLNTPEQSEGIRKKKEKAKAKLRLEALHQRAKEKIREANEEESRIRELLGAQREFSGLRRKVPQTKRFEDERFKTGSGAVKRQGYDNTDMEYNQVSGGY